MAMSPRKKMAMGNAKKMRGGGMPKVAKRKMMRGGMNKKK